MKLSTEQLERLAERVYKVLKLSNHIELDYDVDPGVEERVIDAILGTLEDDAKMEDRLSREAERLVFQQSHIAKKSGRAMEDLVTEVKSRLARSKRVELGDGPDRADTLAEKVFKNIWKVESIDFFSEDQKVMNCIARAIYRFRLEDDRLIEALERLVSKRVDAEPYSKEWCISFDQALHEVREKIVAQQATDTAPTEEGATATSELS